MVKATALELLTVILTLVEIMAYFSIIIIITECLVCMCWEILQKIFSFFDDKGRR